MANRCMLATNHLPALRNVLSPVETIMNSTDPTLPNTAFQSISISPVTFFYLLGLQIELAVPRTTQGRRSVRLSSHSPS
jgi:hypothetical protein